MKNFLTILLLLIFSLVFINCSKQEPPIKNSYNFKTPTVVQNYPTDHLMDMNSAEYSYKAINKLILSANDTIDIEVFYIANKPNSKLDNYIIKPIIEKAKSGVHVRIIVDANMAKTYPVDKLSTIPNIKVIKNSHYDKHGIVHAKIIIVDDKVFYLGSHNLDWITFELNHELGIIYNNESLAGTMKKVFEFDWKNSNASKDDTHIKLAPTSNKPNQQYEISISPPNIEGIKSDQEQLIELMNNAKSEICMQAMQVIGADTYRKTIWDKFNNAILNAANRGVKVRMMMSDWEFTQGYLKWSNQFLQNLISKDKNNNIEIRYSSFPIHNPCVPYSEVDHAKYMVIDSETAWISTANLTESYFTSCRNYSFTARKDKILGKQMLDIFNTMWNSQYITTYHDNVTKVTNNTCSPDK